MEIADITAPPRPMMVAGSSSRAGLRFGRLFGRAVAAPAAALEHGLRRASASPAPPQGPHGGSVVVVSFSDEEGSSVLRR